MFKDKDVICFLGDSITAAGLHVAEIYQVLRAKYRLKCYNCGISGGSADKAITYLYSRCLMFNPDYVVVNFGINDIHSWLYADSFEDKEKEAHKAAALNDHKDKYEAIIRAVMAHGATPIICLPTPYDEVHSHTKTDDHCEEGMKEVRAFAKATAEKYGVMTVDYFTPMQEPEGLIGEDRVHPTPLGQHYMAQIFLSTVGEIPAPDYDAPFVFEDWNRVRFDAEQKLHPMNYVEFCDIYWESYEKHYDLAQKKEASARRMADFADPDGFIPKAHRFFIEKADFRREYEEELYRLTV